MYVSTGNPPENIQLTVEYMVQVYTPMWFKISKVVISHAPVHVFETISKCQNLPSKVRDIVTLVAERNS